MSRAAFLGTPAAAVPALAGLVGIADVELVVTRADKPRGRSSRPHPSPVKEAALEWGLPVATPETASDLMDVIVAARPDVGVIVAYGRILGSDLLAAVPHGFINVHFSELPRWRGAAPVARAIAAGDMTSGVTLIAVDAGLDTGPVLARSGAVPIDDHDRGTLTAQLAATGAELLTAVLPAFVSGECAPEPQVEGAATSAPALTKEEAHLDPARPADQVLRHIRAFAPRPGAWAHCDGSRFQILGAVRAAAGEGVPGEIIADADGVWLWCAPGRVQLSRVRPAGKALLAAEAWWHGRRGEPARLTLLRSR